MSQRQEIVDYGLLISKLIDLYKQYSTGEIFYLLKKKVKWYIKKYVYEGYFRERSLKTLACCLALYKLNFPITIPNIIFIWNKVGEQCHYQSADLGVKNLCSLNILEPIEKGGLVRRYKITDEFLDFIGWRKNESE